MELQKEIMDQRLNDCTESRYRWLSAEIFAHRRLSAARHVEWNSLIHSEGNEIPARWSLSPLYTRWAKQLGYKISKTMDWMKDSCSLAIKLAKSFMHRFLFEGKAEDKLAAESIPKIYQDLEFQLSVGWKFSGDSLSNLYPP
ncbi:hypothetical protein TNCV_4698671 [Trichonephila clavipes]|nr:hypothetical protein TNCV_4698671 [Trichonephila clavipes]